jgi:hypothetical protein
MFFFDGLNRKTLKKAQKHQYLDNWGWMLRAMPNPAKIPYLCPKLSADD